ncbi:MAG: hypothetical protein K0S30_846 [Clostridia bacterium]|nr:hypothetical protein [Clostridia bacterium]
MPVVDDYKAASSEGGDKIYCNCCGKEIIKTEITDTHMDHLHIEKSWGYFSSKDLATHAFNICESCYDAWVSNFAIPIEDVYIEDVFIYSDEELRLLNEAYQKEYCK